MRRHIAPVALAVWVVVALGLGLALGLTGHNAAGAVRTAGPAQPAVHFTAAGDYGFGTPAQAVLGKIAELDPDLNLALGGLSFAATGDEHAWCDQVTQGVGTAFPFELVAGDDESDARNGAINAFSACLPNRIPGAVGTYGRQWYADVPARNPLVRFVMISPGLTFPDGTDQYTADSPQYAWTAAAIDGARTASIPWIVVGMHEPCLSLGSDDCGSGTDLLNLLLTKKVDLVLSGHQNDYERTKQLALAAGCANITPDSADPECIADADADLVKGAGTVLATVGTGGAAQRALDPAAPQAPYFAATSGLETATWGLLDVRATTTTLSARFERASGGSFSDAFTIRPAGPGQNVAPAAWVTTTCTLLDCAVDGSGSTDPDGTIAAYTWYFGDGTTSTRRLVKHHYANGGSYPVTLTVTDDDGATSATTSRVTAVTPLPAVEDYVTRVYADLFDRVPDLQGLETWTTALRADTPRAAVANSITASIEYRSTLIRDQYLELLGRAPDAAEVAHLLGQLDQGMTVAQVQGGVLASQESYDRSSRNDAAWVRALYTHVLRRSATPSEVRSGESGVTDPATGRLGVAMGVLLSPEHLTAVVDDYSLRLLGPSVDPNHRALWVTEMHSGVRVEVVMAGIIASEEYFAKD